MLSSYMNSNDQKRVCFFVEKSLELFTFIRNFVNYAGAGAIAPGAYGRPTISSAGRRTWATSASA